MTALFEIVPSGPGHVRHGVDGVLSRFRSLWIPHFQFRRRRVPELRSLARFGRPLYDQRHRPLPGTADVVVAHRRLALLFLLDRHDGLGVGQRVHCHFGRIVRQNGGGIRFSFYPRHAMMLCALSQ